MKIRYYIVIELVVILIIACFFMYAAGFGPFASKAAGAARDAIRQFTGNPAAVVIFDEHNTNFIGEPYDTYHVDRDQFTVDPATGSVIGTLFLSDIQPANISVTRGKAETIARDYAILHYRNFGSRNMQLTEARTLDHGDAGLEYSFTWNEQVENISIGNTVHVSVNPDGSILSYHARDRPLPAVKPATLGKDDAIRIATDYVINRTKIANITHAETSAALMVLPENTSRVIWNVNLELRFPLPELGGMEDHRGGEVYVDAVTGEVVQYNPCL